MESVLLHGAIESGRFESTLGGYRPRRLGRSASECTFHLLGETQRATVEARQWTVPLIVTVHWNQPSVRVDRQACVGRRPAEIVADLLFTVLSLARDAASSPPSPALLLDGLPMEAARGFFHSRGSSMLPTGGILGAT